MSILSNNIYFNMDFVNKYSQEGEVKGQGLLDKID